MKVHAQRLLGCASRALAVRTGDLLCSCSRGHVTRDRAPPGPDTLGSGNRKDLEAGSRGGVGDVGVAFPQVRVSRAAPGTCTGLVKSSPRSGSGQFADRAPRPNAPQKPVRPPASSQRCVYRERSDGSQKLASVGFLSLFF